MLLDLSAITISPDSSETSIEEVGYIQSVQVLYTKPRVVIRAFLCLKMSE